jgi:hypothetical protein
MKDDPLQRTLDVMSVAYEQGKRFNEIFKPSKIDELPESEHQNDLTALMDKVRRQRQEPSINSGIQNEIGHLRRVENASIELVALLKEQAIQAPKHQTTSGKKNAPQAEEVEDIDELEGVVVSDVKNQTIDGHIYSLRNVEFESLKIDTSLSLEEVYKQVIATKNIAWHKQRQAKGAAPRFINMSSFDSQFYKHYCKDKTITRKRGAPRKPK